MLIGSECDGVGSFPLLAGDDDEAGRGGPAVLAIAARIWVAGGRVPGEPDGPGGVQPAGPGGTGDLQEAKFLAGGKRGCGAEGSGREAGELDGARVSTIAATDLRSAGDAVCAGRRADSE